jgi:nucleotide-binding universal stress UspA family protein
MKEAIMFKCIILALDGSGHSLRALDCARTLAERFDAKLILVHAYPRTSDLRDLEGYDRLVSQRKNAGQEILDDAQERLGGVSLEVEEDLLEGPATDAILSVAEIRQADLIVLGTRGMGSVKGLLVGSVSNKVTHHAPCTVMVVR